MRIDHVIYATADLDAAAARVEAVLGVAVRGGGRHDRIGTHNRIVPLGGGYLELLAVADAGEAARSELGRAVQARIAAGEGLMGWAVAVDDVAPVAGRLGTEISTIRRSGLTAQLTGVAEAMREPFLPFFIARDPGVANPAGPGSGGGPGGISWLEVSGDAGRLRDWLDGALLPVRVADGPPAVLAMGVGDRELR
jgi:catechol 2,3-dioxygenase-like lactoylglutathione lyase family enzyme